jgi:hypothetical protein
MVDSFQFEPIMQAIPRTGFISMHNSAFSNARADESSGLAFRAEYGGNGISAALADDDDDFTFTILIAGISAVAAIFFLICWLYVSTEIAAIDLRHPAFAADNATAHFLRHRFT